MALPVRVQPATSLPLMPLPLTFLALMSLPVMSLPGARETVAGPAFVMPCS